MTETRHIDDAIRMLGRAETWISNRAHSRDDYALAREMRIAAKYAEKELSKLNSSRTEKAVYVSDLQEREPLGCYCNPTNAPCSWCRTHCADCEEVLDECSCGETIPTQREDAA